MAITRLKARISGLLWRITLLLAPSLLAANFAAAQDLGSVNPEPLPPLANPNDPATPAKEPQNDSGIARDAYHRLLFQGLHRRSESVAPRRRDMAGDAPVAQP
jgi:hypothetical protein